MAQALLPLGLRLASRRLAWILARAESRRLARETRDEERTVPATQTATFAIVPKGPFSWDAACDVVAHFSPISRHWAGSGDPLRVAFLLDGTFEPVAVALRWDGDRLAGEVAGTRDVEAVSRQVARIFSLDHDGAGFADLGLRDPEYGNRLAAARFSAHVPDSSPIKQPNRAASLSGTCRERQHAHWRSFSPASGGPSRSTANRMASAAVAAGMLPTR
jgi:hypothetical protein